MDEIETTNEIAWPPAYKLRISKKAKHLHLKVFPHRGLEIVVPIRQRNRLIIDELLASKKSWIEKHLSKVQVPILEVVNTLELRAIEQSWNIEYIPTTSTHMRHVIAPGTTTLKLYGPVTDIARTHQWLNKWLRLMASQYLLPWLQALSQEHQLPFNRASVRGQQTLWGSCTADKNISLNFKLLFIPPRFAEHIMLHELCHTKHLNHSPKFWDLLQKLDPDTKLHDRAVRESDKYVPSCFNE